MSDGDDEIKQCPNCGEYIYLSDAEDVKFCSECGGVICHCARQD